MQTGESPIFAAPAPFLRRWTESGARTLASIGLWRATKLAIGIFVAVLGAKALVNNFVRYTSSSAVVTGRLVYLRAPIDGLVEGDLAPSQLVKKADPLLKIRNPWVDDWPVQSLAARLGELDADGVRRSQLSTRYARNASSFRARSAAFIAEREKALQAELDEAEEHLRSDTAAAEEAEARAKRAAELAAAGATSLQDLEGARRDAAVARHAAEAAAHRADASKAKLAASRRGIIVDPGGSAVDSAYSQQRLDEVGLALDHVQADRESEASLRGSLETLLRKTEARIERLSVAAIDAPVEGRVWQLFASPGEFVTRGQPIASLVNCGDVHVDATVSGRVFRHLRIGTEATLRTETGKRYEGKVVQLVGAPERVSDGVVGWGSMSGALRPSGFNEADDFRVLVSFPKLPSDLEPYCSVGEPGEVTFRP